MPVTPFHFGPGALLKAISEKRISFWVFVVANIVIDVESGIHMVVGVWPIHTFLHTFAGSSTIILPLAATARAISKRFGPMSWAVAIVSATIGAWSHVVLDAIMHSDVRPFAPWSEENPLLGLVSLSVLHLGCVAAAVLGLVVLGLRYRLHRS